MGKHFYGVDKDKLRAMRKANAAAKNYKKGKCYTPSSKVRNACKLDEATGLWRCRATAHHQWGSCGTWELTSDPGRGTEWNVMFPPIEYDNPGGTLGDRDDDDKKSRAMKDESYEDAAPEDYAPESNDFENIEP